MHSLIKDSQLNATGKNKSKIGQSVIIAASDCLHAVSAKHRWSKHDVCLHVSRAVKVRAHLTTIRCKVRAHLTTIRCILL